MRWSVQTYVGGPKVCRSLCLSKFFVYVSKVELAERTRLHYPRAHPVMLLRGVRQGDPLGPLFSALTLQPALEQADAACEEVPLVSHLDNMNIRHARPRRAGSCVRQLWYLTTISYLPRCGCSGF